VLSLAGFLIPFLFVYHPPLLLDGTVVQIGMAFVTGTLGVGALAASTMGFAYRDLDHGAFFAPNPTEQEQK
jgi:TRAP-type uncharacterized transport system fused permease subunit